MPLYPRLTSADFEAAEAERTAEDARRAVIRTAQEEYADSDNRLFIGKSALSTGG